MIILRQKQYADGEGMSTKKKAALAAGAAALTGAAAFAGARRGVFGAKAMQSSNQLFNKAGGAIGGKLGASMQTSANKQLMGAKNLTGVKAGAGGALNANSQRAANAGVKLDTSTKAAQTQLAKGTGINSVSGNKPLSELEYEQMMAFSEHQ